MDNEQNDSDAVYSVVIEEMTEMITSLTDNNKSILIPEIIKLLKRQDTAQYLDDEQYDTLLSETVAVLLDEVTSDAEIQPLFAELANDLCQISQEFRSLLLGFVKDGFESFFVEDQFTVTETSEMGDVIINSVAFIGHLLKFKIVNPATIAKVTSELIMRPNKLWAIESLCAMWTVILTFMPIDNYIRSIVAKVNAFADDFALRLETRNSCKEFVSFYKSKTVAV
ncbi:hypothetical protein P9112_003312 [Eukaryota sp. TZLM1-RC]